MDIAEKLKILSDSAKYDASCSSSGSDRKNTKYGLGNAHLSGICHSWSSDGRCISLLKILLTNRCIYDCVYCVNRATNIVPRADFSPEEIADLTINFYKRNYIEGLFLSSAVFKNPDYTMELMLQAVKILRFKYKFNGYIHLKAIPGADCRLINEAGAYADRMSVNIELPSSNGLKLLAPQKSKEAILKPMGYMNSKIIQREDEKKYKSANKFLPAGQTTQLIVGATNDSDFNILMLTESLYKNFSLKRVYYSAYVPVSDNPNLPALLAPPLKREHRLYQADWLLRFYGFNAGEILDKEHQNLDDELDPKTNWAINNISLFPIEINTADYLFLIRVPGIGIKSAKRIVAARQTANLSFYDLKKLGVVLKRARHFIKCSGKYYGEKNINQKLIKNILSDKKTNKGLSNSSFEQISIFSLLNDRMSIIAGEF